MCKIGLGHIDIPPPFSISTNLFETNIFLFQAYLLLFSNLVEASLIKSMNQIFTYLQLTFTKLPSGFQQLETFVQLHPTPCMIILIVHHPRIWIQIPHTYQFNITK